MKKNLMRSTLWTVSFLLIAALISLWLQFELPTPGGPYAVGRTTYNWVDASRPEILTDDPGDFREVMVLVWYPAVRETGIKAKYIPDYAALSNELGNSGELEPWEVFGLRFIRSESRLNAEPVKDEGPFPVVLFSPGNGTNIEFYSALAGELASHGYIVVGINHPYDVPAVQLSDGSVAPYDKNQWTLDVNAHAVYTAGRIQERTADVLFALDQLHAINADVISPFSGLLTLDSVAVAGHSLGGITASESCKADSRFKACLNLDGLQRGGPFSTDESAVPPSQPFLFLTKESQLHPKLIESFESTNNSVWVVIHDASHDNFTDGPLLQPSLLPIPNQADRFMSLIQNYTLAFLDQILKGQSATLLSEATSQEDVSIRIFPAH